MLKVAVAVNLKAVFDIFVADCKLMLILSGILKTLQARWK